MCGICGAYALTANGIPSEELLGNAIEAMQTRGPDSNGSWSHDKVRMGHVRLSIIDVSSAAAQPFTDPSGRYVIVFNGEIYNFKSLRDELAAKGECFVSQSDTEVILKLFIREGKNFIHKLNGFFAFACYDTHKDVMLIARDRMGIKPLLVYQDDSSLLFASEMKALFELNIPREIDRSSLAQYLHLNYVPPPFSMVQGVRKLVPGSWMEIRQGKITEGKFYQLEKHYHSNPSRLSYDDASKEIIHLLDESVKERLISDVPLGAFLSGGIDSSVIVALASRHVDKLNTYSIGFSDEPYFDETEYAELVAKKYKTNHTVFKLKTTDLYDVLFDVLDYFDEPFADSSALAVNILSRETRKHVTVALSGDGADEMFAGYMKHSGELRARDKGLKTGMVSGLGPLWASLPKSRNSSVWNKVRQFDRFSKGVKMHAGDRYWRWCGFIDRPDIDKILKDEISSSVFEQRKNNYSSLIEEGGDFNDVLYADMHLVLQGDMLTKVDLMSMANSLEVRVPFLDHRLVDFVFSLPYSYKINKQGRKRILRDAFRSLLPEELYTRPKHGFEVPLLKWFRTDLRSMITDDLLSDELIYQQGLFRVEEIRNLKQKLFSSDPGDVHARIWGLIVFQHWWKKYFMP